MTLSDVIEKMEGLVGEVKVHENALARQAVTVRVLEDSFLELLSLAERYEIPDLDLQEFRTLADKIQLREV